MITDLEYVASGEVILTGKVNQKDVSLRFDQVMPYWDYANEDDFEGGVARVYGNKVLLTMLTASMQDGVIVLWNAEKNQIEHVSDGSYALAVDMDEDSIYYLADVFNYKTKANLQLWRIPVGCKDAKQDGERMKTAQLPSADFMIDDFSKYAIQMHGDRVDIALDGKKYSVEMLH